MGIQKSTFTDLTGLNKRQIQAVKTNRNRVLVLAGAGSGKTRTLLQKIIYLINDKNVKPSSILAITFTKNATNEMIDRLILSSDKTGRYEKILNDKKNSRQTLVMHRRHYSLQHRWISKLTIRTFHSLCYYMLRNFGVNEFDNKFKVICDVKSHNSVFEDITAPETAFEVMHKILIQSCDNPEYLLKLKRYILDYYIDKIHIDTTGYYSRYTGGNIYTTLKGDKVKSKSERDIADWLYRHHIQYEYEPKLNIRDFNFRPDFYIPQANLYLEHISGKSYSMKDKEEQFKLADKTLVKTFEPMTRDTTLFNRALERIIKGRLSANYIAESALSFEEEFKSYHKDIRDFVKQVLRVVDMIKVENLNFRRIYTKSQKDPHERVRLFYQLFKPLFEQYNKYCINKSYLDYNDMLIRAISLLKNQTDIRDKFRDTFRHILVDEFQDVNNLQVEFLNTLLTPSTRLFCVGDDWQSIYGFRGSEVDYIINFERYFDNPQIIQLDMNYRSHDSIVNASNEVIRNNKYMVNKEIRASKKAGGKINIFLAENEDDGVEFFVREVSQRLSNGYSGEDILVLYRRSKMFAPYKQRLEEESLKVTGRTIHASKGLEAKVVFIIGLTEGYGGFPDIWLDDRIFQVIKKAKHDLMLEEERRLFYVALTRARDELYLISEKGNESSFLSEIPDEYAISYKQKPISLVDDISLCPKCNLQIEGHYTFCPFCGYKIQTD